MQSGRKILQEPRLPLYLLGTLACALAGLVAAFAINFHVADRQFRLASIAERQASAVVQIAAASRTDADAADLPAALARYRALIAAETALMAQDAATSRQQGRELADAARLAILAAAPDHRAEFDREVRRISSQESREVAAVRRDVGRLHRQTVVLAILLSVVALASAVSGGWLLVQRARTLETEVRARTARIEEIDRSRRLFFAKASHELRTPVTAMRGESEVALANGSADAEALRESLRHLHANAIFLGHRIDELLGLASADDGMLHLAREPLELGAVVRSAADSALAYARSVEVTIICDCPAVPLPMIGDARWLQQAVLTVIDNGLKFSPMGSVLAIALTRAGPVARIAVTDQGPGIMPQDLPCIFDAYYQAKTERSRRGSGLGLALARWVTERHGGTAAAENLATGGCCVTFTLPMEAVA